MIHNPISLLMSLLAPFACLNCGAEGRLACISCLTDLPPIEYRCYKCFRPQTNFRTCRLCRPDAPLASVQAVTLYAGLSKALLLKLKFGRASDAAAEVAALMASRLGFDRAMAASNDIVLTHAPTATSRVRQRGYDQSGLVARHLARRSGIPYRRLLARTGQSEQLGASKRVRRLQLQTAYRAVNRPGLQGRHILLVDDVCTTGASLEAAAAALLQAGARRVDGLVFAKA